MTELQFNTSRIEELYGVWADEASPWSGWAKPILFASLTLAGSRMNLPPLPAVDWAPAVMEHAAIIVDLPDGEAVLTGLALAGQGYRPVPLFNGTAGPGMIVDVSGIIQLLVAGADSLLQLSLPPAAPPALLLDAARQANANLVAPGRFDNRWCAVPQDFPSANRLRQADITTVVLCAAGVQEDLAHVLRRYEEAGLRLLHAQPGATALPGSLSVPRPARFRELWYRLGVLAGLRRNAAGGFGAVVPTPSSGGG